MGPIYMFLKEFKQHTGKDVSIDEIGYETVSLYQEEIDEALIPSDVLQTLDEMVVASSILFTDENGDEFMCIAVQDSETLEYDKYVRWFINNKPFNWED